MPSVPYLPFERIPSTPRALSPGIDQNRERLLFRDMLRQEIADYGNSSDNSYNGDFDNNVTRQRSRAPSPNLPMTHQELTDALNVLNMQTFKLNKDTTVYDGSIMPYDRGEVNKSKDYVVHIRDNVQHGSGHVYRAYDSEILHKILTRIIQSNPSIMSSRWKPKDIQEHFQRVPKDVIERL